MIRFSSITPLLLLVACIATVTQANDVEHVLSPITHLLVQEKLDWSMRTFVDKPSGGKISGHIDGGFEQIAGSGRYTGNFRGNIDPRTKASQVKFDFSVNGDLRAMGADLTYKSDIVGVTKTYEKSINVKAKYNGHIDGTVHGKKINGKYLGAGQASISPKSLAYNEIGSFKYYVGGKPLYGKFIFKISHGALSLAVDGKYNGEKFFFKYSLSLNMLKLGLDMNPMKLTRKYGTVKVTVDGKETTKSFNLKGEQLEKAPMEMWALPM